MTKASERNVTTDLDHRLSRLLEGALPPAEAEALRADPAAQARLAELEAADAIAREVFRQDLVDPIRPEMLAAVTQAEPAARGRTLPPAGTAPSSAGPPARAATPPTGAEPAADADVVDTAPDIPAPRRSDPRRPARARRRAERRRARAAPPREGPLREGVRAARRTTGLALALALGALAVLGVQHWQARDAVPGWIAQVADYHRVYSEETNRLVEIGADEAETIAQWLGGRVGPFTIPDLAEAGLEFRGARLLAAVGKPVAQLVYTDAAGRVVALCLTPRPGTADAPATTRDLGDLTAVDWRREGQAFILIGPADILDLPDIASDLVRQL